MKVNMFNGGLNTRLAPQHINTAEARVSVNMEMESGELRSAKLPVKTDIQTAIEHVYFPANDEWVDFTQPTDSVQYNNVLYYTNGDDAPMKYDGTEHSLLGIVAPSAIGDQTVLPAPQLIVSTDAAVTEVALGTGIKGSEAHYMLVNTKLGAISNAFYIKVDKDGVTTVEQNTTDLITPEFVGDTPTMDLSIEFSNVKAKLAEDGAKIFRYHDDGWYNIGPVFQPGTVFVDNTDNIKANEQLIESDFAALNGTHQYLLTYYDDDKGIESAPSPLSGELDLTEGGSVFLDNLPVSVDPQVDSKKLYRIGGNLTEFSLVVKLDAGVTSYTDNLGDTEIDGAVLTTDGAGTAPAGLKYISEAYAMLFGAIGNTLYFTQIGQPDNWPPLFFLTFSEDITGIAPVASGIIVFGRTSAEIVLGTGPTTFSRKPLAGDQGCIAHKSIQQMGNSALWLSTDGLCVSSGGPVQVMSKVNLGKFRFDAIDSTLHDQVYYAMDIGQQLFVADLRYGTVFHNYEFGVARVSTGDDKLYGWRDGYLEELFASDDDAQFSYTSPKFLEGRATQSKLYKNMYFYVTGDIIIKMYVDNKLAITKRFTGDGNYNLKIPQDMKRGHFIHFDIEGTGSVTEIYWEADANDQ